jgi:hypothetical protein
VSADGTIAACSAAETSARPASRAAFYRLCDLGCLRKRSRDLRIIDTEKENYSVERLLEMKRTHETSDSRRYVITDELVQRLGEMLAAEAEDRPRPPAATAYPDWGINDLSSTSVPTLSRDQTSDAGNR